MAIGGESPLDRTPEVAHGPGGEGPHLPSKLGVWSGVAFLVTAAAILAVAGVPAYFLARRARSEGITPPPSPSGGE